MAPTLSDAILQNGEATRGSRRRKFRVEQRGDVSEHEANRIRDVINRDTDMEDICGNVWNFGVSYFGARLICLSAGKIFYHLKHTYYSWFVLFKNDDSDRVVVIQVDRHASQTCTWTAYRGQYSAGYASDIDVKYDLAGAKAKCLELSSCKFVTCNIDDTCTVRSSATLSAHSESVTWKPSKFCYEMYFPVRVLMSGAEACCTGCDGMYMRSGYTASGHAYYKNDHDRYVYYAPDCDGRGNSLYMAGGGRWVLHTSSSQGFRKSAPYGLDGDLQCNEFIYAQCDEFPIGQRSWSGHGGCTITLEDKGERDRQETVCEDGEVMLADAAGVAVSEVQPDEEYIPWVRFQSDWYPICGHYFWDNDHGATTVCQKLGFALGEVIQVRDVYAQDAMPVGYCSAGEQLNACNSHPWGYGWGDFEHKNGYCKAGAQVGIHIKCAGGTGEVASCGAVEAAS